MIPQPPRQDRSAVDEDHREVEPAGGHEHPGQGLVASGEPDEGVEALGVHDRLDGVRDDLPAHEGGVHALVTHRDAVGDGNGNEFEGKPAGRSHAVLRPLGQPGERQVARRDLVPGRGDTDLRLVEVVVRHPDGAEHRPRRRTPETLGHVLAVNLE